MKNKTLIFLLIFSLSINLYNCRFYNYLYHTNEEVNKIFEELSDECDDQLEINSMEDKKTGKTINYYTITSKEKSKKKNKVLLTFGEKAQEAIGTELAIFLANILCKNNDYPFYNKDTIDKILEQNEINFIPVVNEYGRKRLTQSFVCHKGNENNVDLTRNYDYDFKEIIDKKINPINGINSGRKPFSEYETRLVKEIMKKIKPNIFINTRSGNLTLTAPSDNKKKTKDLLNILDYLKNKYCEECLVGNMDKISNDISGNSVDYAFNKRKVKYAFKFDIFNYDTTTKFNKMISKDKIDTFDFDDFEKDQSFLQIKNKKYYHIMTEEEFENKNAKYVNILKNLDNEYTIDELFFYCVLQKNPIIEKEVNNLLKFWTNVYFDLFSTIYKKENK